MPSLTKKPKPSLKSLNAEIARLQEELARATGLIAEKDDELAGQRLTVAQHSEENARLQSELGTAKAVLKPLYEKTKDWGDEWPPEHVALSRRLTWGDLKQAADAGAAK